MRMLSYNINVDRHETRLCSFCNIRWLFLGHFQYVIVFSFMVYSSSHCIILWGLISFLQYHLSLCPFSIIETSLLQHFFCTNLFLCIEVYYTNRECSVCDFIFLCLYYLESILYHCVSKCRNWVKSLDPIHWDPNKIHSYKKQKDSLEAWAAFSWILILTWNLGGCRSDSVPTFF